MNRDEAKQYILARATEYLERDNNGEGYICPLCGSGTGDKGTGITSKDGNRHFTCWAGCFSNSDIIDIIGMEYKLTNYNDKLQKAADLFHITIDSEPSRVSAKDVFAPAWTENQKQDIIEQLTQDDIHNKTYTTKDTQPQEAEPDYTDFFLQASKDIDKTDYHRGLSLPTLKAFWIGYVESWKHPKAPKMKESPRLIVPTSKHSYLARHASQSDYINYRGQVENKSKVGKVRIFNQKALTEATKPIFVVEGEIDALSVIDVGGQAVALGSAGNWRKLLELVEKQRPAQPLIISLDNDPTGERSDQKLVEGLDKLKIPFYVLNIAKPYKDANEAMNADRDAFRRTIQEAEQIQAANLLKEKEELRRETVAFSLQHFLDEISKSRQDSFYPTGFSSLDRLLDGGLYAGLYIVGAISSLGKTTFVLQIADQIAQRGQDVLIFSLEMSKYELMSKSISRLTLIKDLADNQTTIHAKTTRGILTGSRYSNYDQTEKEIIEWAVANYNQYGADRLVITEGVGNVGIGEIRDKVLRWKRAFNKAPVVVIDYLQILAPVDMRATDKQNTDKAVLELKRLSRDYGIPVLAISSLNRDNYTEPISQKAFKESGAIEYSSDVLIGLQYDGMDYREGEKDGDRQKRIRSLVKEQERLGWQGQAQTIQVKILKHRNGSKGDTVLEFYPKFNYFTEINELSRYGADEWDETESEYNA